MKRELVAEISRLGGDFSDPVWQWLVLNGPHGSTFTWSQTSKEPPRYVGIEHLQRIVVERAETDSSFSERVKIATRKALLSNDVNLLRRAIQVAAVVGDEAELQQISALISHETEEVAADARASAFYLQNRLGT